MKTLEQQLGNYAAYHRDRRNIVTHFIGIPMIVFAVQVLLARARLPLGDAEVSLAVLATVAATLYYLRLDLRYGIVMGLLLALGLLGAEPLAAAPWAAWLGAGLGLFVVGWVFQFIGHHFEGRKPAFVDDIMGLIIGPLFVLAEAGFLLHLRPEVQAAVEQRAGQPGRVAISS